MTDSTLGTFKGIFKWLWQIDHSPLLHRMGITPLGLFHRMMTVPPYILPLALSFTLGCGMTLRRDIPLQKEPKTTVEKTETEEISTQEEDKEIPPQIEERVTPPPKVGVILGPGGSRGFAHTGVIRELLRAQIPIHSLVGVEWGALIGGLFAIKGQVHDTEWKLYKLQRKDFLKKKKSLFKSETKPIGVKRLEPFINTYFGEIRFNKMKVDFACPTLSVGSGILQWQNQGSLKRAIQRCWPYPPMFEPKGTWVAGAFAIPESITYLKNRGMDIIIFVNVMDGGDLLPPDQLTSDYRSSILWQTLRRFSNNTKILESLGVEVIHVKTKNFKLYSFDNRRSLVKLGEQAGKKAAEKLWSQYDFTAK